MEFGFVYHGTEKEDQSDIPKNFNVKTFPTLLVKKDEKTKKDIYKGEMKYKDMFEFLNLYSQQFVPTNVGGNADDKPWRF